MKILVYGINYAPELTGIGKYTGEMCTWLAEQGHQVEVITAMPYYPDWEVAAAYKGKWWHTERMNGVTVRRCPIYVPKQPRASLRILQDVTFLLSTLVYWAKALFQKHDLIITIAPPFHIGLIANWVARWKGIPNVYHIQDLQVDAARDLGMIRSQRLLAVLEKVERRILRRATQVSTISEGMLAKVEAKLPLPYPILLFPNWVDDSVVYPLSKAKSLRAELGLADSDFVVLYSGNIGEKQGLDVLPEVADYFRAHAEVKFVIVGSGAYKEALMQEVAKNQLGNVLFFPLQPYEKLSALLAAADVHLVLQKKAAADLVMPSKFTGIMASGGFPIVTAEPGTSLHDVVEKHDLGLICPPEDAEALILTIRKAMTMDSRSIKANALAFARQYLLKDGILSQWVADLSRLRGSEQHQSRPSFPTEQAKR